jgi:hypothetical protein
LAVAPTVAPAVPAGQEGYQAVDLVVGARRQRRLMRATVRRLRAGVRSLPIEVASNDEAVGVAV